MRLFPMRALLALAAFGLLTTASAGNAATLISMRTVAGTQLPLVRQSARLAATADSTPVSVVLSLQPRNRGLLTHAATSGKRMSEAKLRQTFAPSPGNLVAITRYMQSHGFRLTSSGLLSLSFFGDAGAARRAFGVGLSTYRSPGAGCSARRRRGEAARRAGAAGRRRVRARHGASPPAARERERGTPRRDADLGRLSAGPGYQPSEFAQAYNHDALLAAGFDGGGEKVGTGRVHQLPPRGHHDI